MFQKMKLFLACILLLGFFEVPTTLAFNDFDCYYGSFWSNKTQNCIRNRDIRANKRQIPDFSNAPEHRPQEYLKKGSSKRTRSNSRFLNKYLRDYSSNDNSYYDDYNYDSWYNSYDY